ncbi:hypothetical protein HMPREF9586_01421 [Cutibacterium acnes HL083PA2]|nr:hypothetical protein HMPREF9586_01421 [Cutibacterium acnes HL083PA2]
MVVTASKESATAAMAMLGRRGAITDQSFLEVRRYAIKRA